MIMFTTLVMEFRRIRRVFRIRVLLTRTLLLRGPPMINFSRLMGNVRQKSSKTINTRLQRMRIRNIQRHRLLQTHQLLKFTFPGNRRRHLRQLTLLRIMRSILSVRKVRNSKHLLNMNRVRPITTLNLNIGRQTRPLMKITHISRRSVQALLPMLAGRVIHRVALTQTQQSRSGFVPVHSSTTLRQGVQSVRVGQGTQRTIKRLSSRKQRQQTMINLPIRGARNLVRGNMRALLNERINLITKGHHPRRRQRIRHIIVQHTSRRHRLQTRIITSTLRLHFILNPYRSITITPCKTRPLQVHLVRMRFSIR